VKKHLPTIFVALMLVFGLSLLFYPDIASWWNGRSQRAMVALFDEEVARLSREHIENQFRRAAEVNTELGQLPPAVPLLVAHLAPILDDYYEILYVGGVMGRLNIPSINVNMPIFHGTGHDALNRGVGHMEGTAFPIGGESTHSVLTAHTGLANAIMFNHLEANVTYGDLFFITVMDVTKAYQVFYTRRILPHEVAYMRVVPGEDIVTLMTCTPYAINSHRWLVHGRRVEYTPHMAEEIEQAIDIVSRLDIRAYIFVGLFVMFIVIFMVYSAIKGKRVPPPRRSRRSRPIPPAPVYPQPVQVHMHPMPPYVQPAQTHIQSQVYAQSVPVHAHPAQAYAQPVSQYTPPIKSVKPKRSASTLNRVLTGKNAFGKRKTIKKPMISTTGAIAAGFVALLLVMGIAIAVMQSTGQSSRSGNQATITDFVSRIEMYEAEYRDRWVAEQLTRWMEGGELSALPDASESPLSRLHQQVIEHNHRLYESGQGNLPNPFDYSQNNFNLSYFGFADEEMIGFVTIPSIDTELPIFMGTSRENLQRGLAHVTNTSFPVGGVNTNAVIAGYMGLRHADILRNIAEISIGDEIHVTNFYETITYIVAFVYQGDSVPAYAPSIQSGRDLLTLMGYRQGSNERYMVIAQRNN